MKRLSPALFPIVAVLTMSCAPVRSGVLSVASATAEPRPGVSTKTNIPRAQVIARARVWEPTDIAGADIKTGPTGHEAFAFGESVACSYVKRAMAGKSPKFMCQINGDDEIKVKYGATNGEVYGEVAATRLLWALGFGADRMYPVKVVCTNCPASLNGTRRSEHETVFDPASVERKMSGTSYHPDDGWAWPELELVDEAAGGATRAQKDALKLIAVFLQHTDSKPEQQRLICVNEPKTEPGATPECKHPFMLLNDVGLTFGRANTFNSNAKGGVNLARWSETSIWKNSTGCIGNLPKSMTGTLKDPVISEQGRLFLADLLMQLSDTQIHDLFETARVQLRLRNPDDTSSGYATVDEWVKAFKEKRNEIVTRRCTTT